MSTGKTKKVTIRYVRRTKDEDSPLYCQITYDRKSTRFKVGNDNGQYSTDKEEWIKRLIQYEAERVGEGYHIKGIGDRISFYESPLLEYLSPVMENELLRRVQRVLTYSEYRDLIQGLPSEGKIESDFYQWYYLVYYLWVIKHDFNYKLEEIIDEDLHKLFQAYLAFILFENAQLLNKPVKGFNFQQGVLKVSEWLLNREKVKNDFSAILHAYLKDGSGKKIVGAEKFFFDDILRHFSFEEKNIKFVINELDRAVDAIANRQLE